MNEIDHIYEHVQIEATLQCTSCGITVVEHGLDEYASAEAFAAKGWRATSKGNCYCSTCAQVKLKLKKKIHA